jgi:hypothetical protein
MAIGAFSFLPRSSRGGEIRSDSNYWPLSSSGSDVGWRWASTEIPRFRAAGKLLDHAGLLTLGKRYALDEQRRELRLALHAEPHFAVGILYRRSAFRAKRPAERSHYKLSSGEFRRAMRTASRLNRDRHLTSRAIFGNRSIGWRWSFHFV